MFAYEAAILLKDVACPSCKKRTQMDMGSPFRIFNAQDLADQCDTKECLTFFKDVDAQFHAYDAGLISRSDLQAWLDTFKM